MICLGNKVLVDGKIRKDRKFPLGMMDVVSIPDMKRNYRILIDYKGRFKPVKISEAEASYKLLRCNKVAGGQKNTQRVATTHDGRCIALSDNSVQHMDTLIYDINTKEVKKVIKFCKGALVMASQGANRGRVGILKNIIKHPGAIDVVEIQDASSNVFNTRLEYVFVIGAGYESCSITLPKGDGLKLSNNQDRDERIARQDEIREAREQLMI